MPNLKIFNSDDTRVEQDGKSFRGLSRRRIMLNKLILQTKLIHDFKLLHANQNMEVKVWFQPFSHEHVSGIEARGWMGQGSSPKALSRNPRKQEKTRLRPELAHFLIP